MKIDKLLSIEIKDLNNYILQECSRKEKIQILKSKEIRERYLNIGSYNYAFFAFLMIGLKSDIKYMIDEDFIDLVFSDDSLVEDKIRCLVVCCPDIISEFSNDVRIMDSIINSEQLIRHVNKLDSRFGKHFLDYIADHNMMEKFLELNENVQADLLKSKINLELLKKAEVSDLFISLLSREAIINLMSDEYFRNRIVNMRIDVIDTIVKKDVTIPMNERVINKYVDISDINLYRAYMENLNKGNSNLVDVIEGKRKKKYDYIFDSVSDDGLIEEYQKLYNKVVTGKEIEAKYVDLVMGFYGNHENIFKFLLDESSECLHNILIDRYFEDIPYNFMMNLEMILNFVSSVDVEIINIDNLKLYNKIYNFNDLTIKDKISLYKSMDDGRNYIRMFYDDYRKCRDYAYSLYNQKVLKPENMNKSELSSKYGVDVYELDGQDFTAYVHQTKYDRNSYELEGIWGYENNFKNGVALSLSMINQNHFETIYGLDLFVCFGFSNLDIDRIMHVYHTDSYTKDFKSDRVNEILTTDMLMKKTESYNEIFYLEDNLSMKYGNKKYEKLMPSYILCDKKITELEVEIAKMFNIPIVLLHSDKYVNKKYFHSSEDKIYLTGYESRGFKR